MFRPVDVESFRSQQCRWRSRLHSKRCLRVVLNSIFQPGVVLIFRKIPAWPFFGKPFFGTRQYCNLVECFCTFSRRCGHFVLHFRACFERLSSSSLQASYEVIKEKIKEAASSPELSGIIGYTEDQVSCFFAGRKFCTHSWPSPEAYGLRDLDSEDYW